MTSSLLLDGFHTSASDPELQKKYGHTRNVIDIAPPPIFSTPSQVQGQGQGGMTVPPQQYSMYSQPSGQHSTPPPTISRYVAYDPYTPAASTLAPIPTPQTYQYSTPATQPAMQPNTFQHPIMSDSAMVQLMRGAPIAPNPVTSSSHAAVDSARHELPPASAEAALPPQIIVAATTAEQGGAASFFSPSSAAAVAELTAEASGVDSLSDSFCEVEILDASSSSVL